MTTFLVPKNNANSTLLATITAGATSLAVATGEGARFPSTFPYHISIDSEILQVTARTTDTLTVVRGQESTAGAAHSLGAAVRLNITAKAISEIQDAHNAHVDATTGIHGAGSNYIAHFGQANQVVNKIVWLDASVSVMADSDRTVALGWTDLDLTASTSASAKFAILRLSGMCSVPGTGDTNALLVRKNGTTPANCPDIQLTYTLPAWTAAQAIVIVGLDAGQVLEYSIAVAVGAHFYTYIQVLGYIE
jgi:hypothetical protein